MINKLKKVCLPLLVFVFTFITIVTPVKAASLPDSPQNFYYDETGLLDQTTENLITQKNRFYAQQSKSPQVVVAVVKSTDGDSIQDYASRLFEKWKIGDKSKNNGVLILYALNDGQPHFWIEVGYGLEGDLTDAQAGKITENNKAALQSKDTAKINQALQNVFKSVTGTIDKANNYRTDETKYAVSKKPINNTPPLGLSIAIIVILVVVVIFLIIIRPRRVHERDQQRHSLLWWILWLIIFNNRGGRGGGGFWNSGGDGGSWGSGSSGGGFSGGGGSSGGGGAGF